MPRSYKLTTGLPTSTEPCPATITSHRNTSHHNTSHHMCLNATSHAADLTAVFFCLSLLLKKTPANGKRCKTCRTSSFMEARLNVQTHSKYSADIVRLHNITSNNPKTPSTIIWVRFRKAATTTVCLTHCESAMRRSA